MLRAILEVLSFSMSVYYSSLAFEPVTHRLVLCSVEDALRDLSCGVKTMRSMKLKVQLALTHFKSTGFYFA